jgi:hypothetical protein
MFTGGGMFMLDYPFDKLNGGGGIVGKLFIIPGSGGGGIGMLEIP